MSCCFLENSTLVAVIVMLRQEFSLWPLRTLILNVKQEEKRCVYLSAYHSESRQAFLKRSLIIHKRMKTFPSMGILVSEV